MYIVISANKLLTNVFYYITLTDLILFARRV